MEDERQGRQSVLSGRKVARDARLVDGRVSDQGQLDAVSWMTKRAARRGWADVIGVSSGRDATA